MKLAVVFPCGHVTSTPSILSLITLLAKKGFNLDIYTAVNKTTVLDESLAAFKNKKNINLNVYFYKSKDFYENISFLLAGFFPWFIKKSINKKYKFLIAVGVRALFIVGVYSFFTKNKYAYFSLELYIKKEMGAIKRYVFKALECFFNRRAVFSIIQDNQRKKILQRENGVDSNNILVFPNSYLLFSSESHERSILNRYNISKDKKVILYGGSIFARWAMTNELIKDVKNWPDEWVLLLHSRAKLTEIRKYLKIDWKNLDKKIIFSEKPLNDYEYENLAKACRIGVALYNSGVSENIKYVGYSSGKIAQYLKCAKPVIINNLPLLNEMVVNFRCGIVINEINDIKKAIIKIDRDYDNFSKNALKAYNEIFKPELYIDRIINRLNYILRK